jgi:flagellar biosynthesis/type III secretory pathway protein FliH
MQTRPVLLPDGPIIDAPSAGIWTELTEARAAVEAFERDARLQAMAERETARQEGFAQGLAEAAEVTAQAARSAQDMLDDLARQLPEFATHVVIEMLGQMGPVKTLASAARRATRALGEDTVIICKVHPDLADRLQAALADEPETARLQIRPDASQDVLGCRLETATTSVDLSLDRQIERLRRSFGAALASGS